MILLPTDYSFSSAITILQRGGVVAFPTETYYGLGVDPFNCKAVSKLYKIKQRNQHKPVLVLVDGIRQAAKTAALPLPPNFYQLADNFWPGALTLICKAGDEVPVQLTGNSGTIGMRHTSNLVAHKLVQLFGGPITATSANISGHMPAVTAQQVMEFFPESVDMIIDGGKTAGNKGSTLVKCEHDNIQCLREGVVAYKNIVAFYKTVN